MKKFVTRQLREQLQAKAASTPGSVISSIVGNTILNKFDGENSADSKFNSAQIMHSVGTAMFTKQHVAMPSSSDGVNLTAFPELRQAQRKRNEKVHHRPDRFNIPILDVAQHCAIIYDIHNEEDEKSSVENQGHGNLDSIPGFKPTVSIASLRCDPSFQEYTYGTDMAYSLYLATSDTYLLVFRGTVADNMLQWVQNVATPLTQIRGWFATSPLPPPSVDKKGWFGRRKPPSTPAVKTNGTATRRLKELGWEKNADVLVQKFVSKQLEIASDPTNSFASKDLSRSRYVCCGHSRGGYLSLLGGSYLRRIIQEKQPTRSTDSVADKDTLSKPTSFFRLFGGSGDTNAVVLELPTENVAVVGFGMPVVNTLTEDALRNIDTVSCFIHINDVVGQYNIEKGHVDVHLSTSNLHQSDAAESKGDSPVLNESKNEKGAWGSVVRAVSSVSSGVSSAVNASKDLSLAAHSMDTYIANVVKEW